MSELNTIKELENTLNIELYEKKEIGWKTRGYVKDANGNLIWLV